MAACAPNDGPYLEFFCGGFVFNYRLVEADYGFVMKRLRRIPEGTIIEARLENPAGGEPFVLRETASWDRLEYVFRSPAVRGVKTGRDYRVQVCLLDPADRRVIATYERTFRSDLGQSVLPGQSPWSDLASAGVSLSSGFAR